MSFFPKRNGIWKYIKSYKFKSLFTQYFFLLLLLSVLPLLFVSWFESHYYSSVLEDEVSTTYQNSIGQIRDSLDTTLNQIDGLSKQLAMDENLLTLLQYAKFNDLSYEDLYKINGIEKSIALPSSIYHFVESVYVYSDRESHILTSNNGRWSLQTFYDLFCIEKYDKGREYHDSWYEIRKAERVGSSDEENWLTFYQSVPIYSQKKTGSIMININIQSLRDFIISSTGNYSDMYMLDKDNRIIFSSNNDATGDNVALYDKNIPLISLKDGNSQFVTFKERSTVYSVAASTVTNWKLVFVVPLVQYMHKINSIKHMISIFILVAILLSVVLSFIIGIRIYEPINDIMDAMKKPQNWSSFSEYNEENTNQNELKLILSNINQAYNQSYTMQDTLNTYVEHLKKAQNAALQAQISPHFLYNTLETINWMSLTLTKGENKVSIMISTLSKLLRYVLETKSTLVTLNDEIEYTKLYFEIQRVRFNNTFDIVWDINEELIQYKIPKIILQPILENSIIHGFKPTKKSGLISIKIFEVDGRILIEVTDNGAGIPVSLCSSINKDMSTTYSQRDKHIGLYNVNLRIKLIFGEDYGLSIKSCEGSFTTVVIAIPMLNL